VTWGFRRGWVPAQAARSASGHEKFPVSGQQPCDHGERQGKRREPAGSVTASAAILGPRSQQHSSIRWQADCGARGHQARAPQLARQLLFSPQPANTVSDKRPSTWSRTGHRPGSHVRVPGFSDGRCQRRSLRRTMSGERCLRGNGVPEFGHEGENAQKRSWRGPVRVTACGRAV